MSYAQWLPTIQFIYQTKVLEVIVFLSLFCFCLTWIINITINLFQICKYCMAGKEPNIKFYVSRWMDWFETCFFLKIWKEYLPRKAPPSPERDFGMGQSGIHLLSTTLKASSRLMDRRENPATKYRMQGADGVRCLTHGDLCRDNSLKILAKCSRQAGTWWDDKNGIHNSK